MSRGKAIAVAAMIGVVALALFVGTTLERHFEHRGDDQTEEPVTDGAQTELERLVALGSPVLGDRDAGVTLVEFGDYQCVACNRFYHQTEGAILQNYVETGKVKMVFMDFTIIGQDSVNAAHGAHCAAEQDLYWEYHNILYDNWGGENTGWASPENLKIFAEEIGLDVTPWTACMNEARYQDNIQASFDYARENELPGTPSFLVVGPQGGVTKLIGPQPYEAFAKVFEEKLAA